MDLEDIMLSEISQVEKDYHHTPSLTCGTKKKKNPVNITTKKEAESQIQKTNE